MSSTNRNFKSVIGVDIDIDAVNITNENSKIINIMMENYLSNIQ